MLHRVIKIQMLKVSYIKIYKCKNRYREREPGGAGGAGPCAPSPGSFCCLSFFCVCVFFLQKNPKIRTRFPPAPGARGSSSSSSPAPGASPGKGKQEKGGKHWVELRGEGNAQFLCGNGPGRVGSRGAPPAPPSLGGSRPDPKRGAGKFLLGSIPRSSAPPRPGAIPRRSFLPGSPQIPDFPSRGIHTRHPRPALGCERGRKRRVWEEERKGPGPPTAGRAGSWKTLFGDFFSKLSLFPTPFYFCREPPPAVPHQNPEGPSHPFPFAPDRLSSKDSPFPHYYYYY